MGHNYLQKSSILSIDVEHKDGDFIEDEENYVESVFDVEESELNVSHLYSSFNSEFETHSILPPQPPKKIIDKKLKQRLHKRQQPKPNSHQSICMYEREVQILVIYLALYTRNKVFS